MCSQPFPLVCSPPPLPFDLLYHQVLGLGALLNHPRNLPSPKSYTRAGLQGIVNCSCSANLHKSILNQLSGLRRVRAGCLAGWKRTGYAQVLDETRRDATQRNATQRNATQRNASHPHRNATRRDATRRDATRRDAMPSDATYLSYRIRQLIRITQGVLNVELFARRRYACAIVPTHHDLRVRVSTRSNRVTPDGVSNRRDRDAGAKKFRGVTTVYRVTEERGARQ